MAALNIPTRYRPGLEALRTWSSEDTRELQSALSAMAPATDPDRIVGLLVEKLPKPRKEIESVVAAVTSLYMYLGHADTTVGDTVHQIVRLIASQETTEEQRRFGEVLVSLLSIGRLQVAFKAAGLLRDHDHVFSLAKVITDVRPVFGAEVGRPVGAVVVHTLNVHYFQDGEHREFRVALDGNDLKLLRETLSRAERKASSLHDLLSGLEIPLHELD